MKTIRENKNNWTGEECEIVIQDDGTFTIGMDYTFMMEEVVLVDEDGEWGKRYVVTCQEEPNWKWVGYGLECKRLDVPFRVTFFDAVEREHENPYVAFAQLAWNII